MTTGGRNGGGDLPYTGALGATRREAAFVTGADGVARRVDLVRALNAVTDPALARAALAGELHRLDDGTELAVPYVFHDPAARRFALVVPQARAHEELTLRAELLVRLAADTSAPVPAYVREGRAVVGTEGLRRFLDAPSELRLGVVARREERLRERAEDVTLREDELRLRTEELEFERADLEVREQELERRLAELLSREEALAGEERALRANISALAARERRLDARAEALAAREAALRGAAATRPGSEPDEDTPLAIEPDEERDDDDATDSGRPRSGPPARRHAPPSEGTMVLDTSDVEEVTAEGASVPQPSAAAVDPVGWAGGGERAAGAAVVGGEVRLWARGRSESAARTAAAGATLLLQADPDSRLPLALLTVVTAEGRPFARVALDATRPDDRAVLESLARDFRVRMEVLGDGRRPLGSYPVGAPREANAQRVLAALAARPPGSEEARRAGAEALLARGISSAVGEAFERTFADESALGTAAGAAAAAEAYEPLLEPAARERLVLSHGVSPTRVQALGKRVVLAALRCGVVPSPRLVAYAREAGLAADERALATRALMAYARTCESGLEAIGHSRADAARTWGALLEWAARAGAQVPDAARAAARALYDPEVTGAALPPDPRPAPTPDELRAAADDALETWLDHPEGREAAAREMARRGAARFAAPLARAVRMLGADVATELAADLVAAGDALGDVWVELLGSRCPHAPPLAAAATVAIHLRRGLQLLLQRAMAADNADWRLYGWAAGEFGTAATRGVGRLGGTDIERLAWVLAHAVRVGAGREVDRLRTAGEGLGEAAGRAFALADEARSYDAALRHGPGGSDGERVAHRVLARATGRGHETLGARLREGV